MENFSMRVLPPPKNYSGDRVIDTLTPSHGSADPAKPALSPYPEKRSSYKHKRFSTSLLVLVFLFLTAVLPLPAVFAEDEPGIILGSGAITTGNKVYFGTYNEKPVLWRVLKTGDGKALLISNDILDNIQFNSHFNVWQGSNAETWCSSFYNNWPAGIEKNAILPTRVQEENDQTFLGYPYYYKGGHDGNNYYGKQMNCLMMIMIEKHQAPALLIGGCALLTS